MGAEAAEKPEGAEKIKGLLSVLCTLCGLGVAFSQPFLGRISFPNSGSPAAQAPFIRGVLLLHSFEYDDAIEAFKETQRADPGFALAYWGEALSYNQPLWYNENQEKARAALAKLAPTAAKRQARAPTAREKGYLEAVERLYGAGPKTARDRAYADRMGELSRENPSDEEAAAFYALALLATIPSGSRNPAVSLQAGAIATAILKRNSEHPGAAHYSLHAFDDGEHAAMGLDAARIYAKIAPASSHARHMPSHVFLPLGMWDEAAASDESAYAASVGRAKRKGLSPAQYDFHALGWLQYEYLQQGRFAKAQELIREVEQALSLPAPPALPARPAHPAHESEIGRGFSDVSVKSERASMRARLIVERGAWDLMRGQPAFDNVDELFALGLASVKLGDRPRAEAALGQLDTARKSAPDADNRQLAELMYREVGGLYQILRGERAEGLAALGSAAALERERPKPIARPYPIKPAGELYAEALLAAGDAAGAVREFKEALSRTPRRAASLIGLVRASKAAGQNAEAARAASEFVKMWRLADRNRPELVEARGLAK